MTDYTLVSRFRNKTQCEYLVSELEKRGKTCYNFLAIPADPLNPDAHPEVQMKNFEAVEDFLNDPHFKYSFNEDLKGLKNAKKVILLLPAGISAHMEAGIAYGLGKSVILIGRPEKPETLYMIFDEVYPTVEDFLGSLK